jgi:hypothetical protein
MLAHMASNQQTRPGIGELAMDTTRRRIGVVTSEPGTRVRTRPAGGGVEWNAMPDNVVAPTVREELSAGLATKDGDSRDGL